MLPVENGDRLENDHRTVGFAGPQEPVHVLAEPQPWVEDAHPLEDLSAVETASELIHEAGLVVERTTRAPVSSLREEPGISEDGLQRGFLSEAGQLELELFLGPQVVGVEKGDEVTPGHGEAPVSGG